MTSYLLDTSIIIDYLRGVPKIVAIINNIQGTLASSYICLAELYEGVNRVKEKEQLSKAVDNFFSSLSAIFGIDESIAKEFGAIRASLKQKGNLIEDLDLILAATCLTYELTLITLNKKHFARITGLNLYPL